VKVYVNNKKADVDYKIGISILRCRAYQVPKKISTIMCIPATPSYQSRKCERYGVESVGAV